MKWLNLEIATLHSETYIGEDPVGRATWLALLTYCAEQENGGFLAGCAEWKDRKWQQVMGVTLEEVRRPSGLWAWEGGGLRVWKYPVEKEREVAQKRLAAAATNKIRGPRAAPASTPSGLPPPEEEAPRPAARAKTGVQQKPGHPEALLYAAKIGLPEPEVGRWFNHYDSNGWRVGRNPMRNWQAAMRNWKLTHEERRSQNSRGAHAGGYNPNALMPGAEVDPGPDLARLFAGPGPGPGPDAKPNPRNEPPPE